MKENEICKNCMFYYGEKFGSCRKKAPIIFERYEFGLSFVFKYPETKWPAVCDTDWCGDYWRLKE